MSPALSSSGLSGPDLAGPDLSRFRYHTGAALRKVSEEEGCPTLFRDLGPLGMALYLAGRLPRLAGPLSPLLYLRTARYTEPYTDHEEIGRLAILQPRVLSPWHSGVPEVYVADVSQGVQAPVMACVPADWATPAAEQRLAGLPDAAAVREALGGVREDRRLADLSGRLSALQAQEAAAERLARPVRVQLQQGSARTRAELRKEMAAHGIGERDLCSAWHHLPREHRTRLTAWLAARDA